MTKLKPIKVSEFQCYRNQGGFNPRETGERRPLHLVSGWLQATRHYFGIKGSFCIKHLFGRRRRWCWRLNPESISRQFALFFGEQAFKSQGTKEDLVFQSPWSGSGYQEKPKYKLSTRKACVGCVCICVCVGGGEEDEGRKGSWGTC